MKFNPHYQDYPIFIFLSDKYTQEYVEELKKSNARILDSFKDKKSLLLLTDSCVCCGIDITDKLNHPEIGIGYADYQMKSHIYHETTAFLTCPNCREGIIDEIISLEYLKKRLDTMNYLYFKEI